VFAVTVSDHVMVAHSLHGELFGPAQRLHGATYVVEATFRGPVLGAEGVLLDIGRAAAALRTVLDELDYRNLDELPELAGTNTTTEVLARHVADRLAAARHAGGLEDEGRVDRIAVTLRESPTAAASYERAP
jgi:6-pyruvoyl-tetrahydropterin synthase